MYLKILGPIEATDGGRRINLGPLKQQTVLAVLLCRANQAIPAEGLIAAVWGREPPRTAWSNLRGYIADLRKVVPDIERECAGYVIRVQPGHLDADRFEQLDAAATVQASSGDPLAASALYEEALRLWRGPAFGKLADNPAVAAEARRLNQNRLTIQEKRIECELRLGRHASLVAELSKLTAENPYHEGLHGQLMLALYRSGRQAEALQVYRDVYETLSAELGLSPGPELRRLEQAILAQDPELHPPAQTPVNAALR